MAAIDEGIEILTGTPAGKRSPKGKWTAGSVNARVDARLRELAVGIREFDKKGNKDGKNGKAKKGS